MSTTRLSKTSPLRLVRGPTSTSIESEASHFTTHFSILGLPARIFRTSRGELCDVITIIQLVGHVAQEITEQDVELTAKPTIDSRVRVEAEGLLS